MHSGMKRLHPLVLFLFLCQALPAFLQDAGAAAPQANYDESKTGEYTLPDPLKFSDGSLVKKRKDWVRRRAEILDLFRSEVFGRAPAGLPKPTFEVTESDSRALDGKATRKQVTIWLLATNGGPKLDLLLYIPNGLKRPAPAFIGLNFGGNHTVTKDPAVHVTKSYVRSQFGKNGVANEESRGLQTSRWPIEKIIDRGYALATAYYGDIEPDYDGGWTNGIRGAVASQGAATAFSPDAWGAIGAWAWGLSRAVDYLQTDPQIDSRRVAVVGHSRLGKTALWAGAQDERFGVVISNNSGEGGAALARRLYGETTQRINTSFPHWFCGNYKKYNANEAALPVDAHMLIALSAPRRVYVASAEEDRWADPKGEFLAAKHAGPVYRLFGLRGLPSEEMPPVNKSVGKAVGYHIRTGGHDIRDFDWDQYLDFADRNLPARKS